MAEKIFDRADLLKFFEESNEVGEVRAILPPQSLYDNQDGKLEVFPVEAETTCLWCEKYGFAVVVRKVIMPSQARKLFPMDHILRTRQQAEVCYGSTSSEMVRWAVDQANTWQDLVKWSIPTQTFDLRPTQTDDNRPTGVTVDDLLAGDE